MSAISNHSEIIDLLDDCVIIRGLDGRVTGWNRAAEKVYGIPREQALGASMDALFEQAAEDMTREAGAILDSSGGRTSTITRRARGASTFVLVLATLKIQRDVEGGPVAFFEIARPVAVDDIPGWSDNMCSLMVAAGVVVVTTDVTEIKRILASLDADPHSDHRQRLRSKPHLVQEMMRATAVLNVMGQPAGSIPPFGLFGQDLFSFWPEESAEAFVDIIVTACMKGSSVRSSCRLVGADGRTFDAEVSAVPTSLDGDRTHLLLAIRDVSVERQAFEVIEASERRYRNLFEYMPIALTQVDASGLVELFGTLRKQGVADLSTYIDEHPEFMNAAMEAMLVEQVNQSSAELFGAESQEHMKGPITRYWDASQPTLRKSLEARYQGEDFFQQEAQIRRMDGDLVDVLYAASRHSSLPNKSLVAFMDISDRKRADQALRRSERRYQDLFQAMTVSFWELDLTAINDLLEERRPGTDGNFAAYLRNYPDCVAKILRATRIVDVNDQTLALFGGAGKSDLLGTLDQFWSPEHWVEGAAAVLTVLINNESVTIETRLRRLDGVEFHAQFTLWFSTDDRCRGLAAVTDISERVNAYSQLEQSEQRFRDLFQHVPVPVLQVNSTVLLTRLQELKDSGVHDIGAYMIDHPDLIWTAMESTVIEQANAAALKLLGTTAEQICGPITPLWRNHPESYARLLRNRYRDVGAYEEDVTFTTFDGRIREGLLTVTFPPGMAGSGVTINAFVDMTEKRQAERRLRQIEAEYAHAARISMLGELTASIAHEVNQPLAAITTYGEAGLRWLNRPNPALSEVREIVNRIVDDAQRAAGIIARVRSMASPQMHQEIMPLDELVAEAVLFLRHEFQSHSIKVTVLPSNAAACISADRIQLQQVIVNLAINAVQAIATANAPRREIVLRTTEEGPHVRCSVEDSGPGIAPDEPSRVFETFFTTKRGGMGMGLPISRSIIEAHGGRMSADSNSVLGGARFSFSLPVVLNG
jgi:PAS domain S-box-containing protein